MALARRRGLEYPAWTVRLFEQSGFRPGVPESPHIVCRHLGRECVHAMFVARNALRGGAWGAFARSMFGLLAWSPGQRWYNSARLRVLTRDTLGVVAGQLGRGQS